DDLDQLVLGVVDARHVVEGDADVVLLVVAPRLALADAHQAAQTAALLRRAPEHPDVEPDEEQRGTEPEQEREQRVAILFDGPGADLDLVVDEELLQPLVDERRQGGGELPRGLGRPLRRSGAVGALVARRRPGDVLLEAAGERITAAVDRLDVALAHLLLEEGVGHRDRRLRARLHQLDEEEVREQDSDEPEPGPARRHPGPLAGLGRSAALAERRTPTGSRTVRTRWDHWAHTAS